MRENWETYHKNLEGQEVIINVDVSIYSNVDDVEFIHSNVTFVEFKLKDLEDKKMVLDLEEQLAHLVTKEDRGHYVGQIIANELVTFFYYVQSDHGWQKALKEYLETFKNYEISSETQEDEEWAYYKKLLYPTVKEWQKIDNTKVCQQLLERGDDLERLRSIEHKLHFISEYKRRDLIESLEEEGFTIKEDFMTVDGFNGFTFEREDNVNIESINQVTAYLVEELDIHDAIYDGWETTLVYNHHNSNGKSTIMGNR